MNFLAGMPSSHQPGAVDDVYLRPGDAIQIMGKLFVVQSRSMDPPGFIVSDPDTPRVERTLTSADIKAWWLRHRLKFIAKDDFSLPIGVRESLDRTMRAFRETEQTAMYMRQAYCQALDGLGADFSRSKATIEPVCARIAGERGEIAPSWTTVYKWWKCWARAGRDIRALCPSNRRRGNRSRKLDQYMLDALEIGVAAWLKKGRPHKMTAYSAVVAHCVKHHGGQAAVEAMLAKDKLEEVERNYWPSYRTFCDACSKVDRTEMLVNRYGDQSTRYEMYPVGAGPEANFPFERVEADFKYLRIFVVDDKTRLPLGTPYLMAAIDCYSGVVAGFDLGFDPPSYAAAARCLKHIVAYKDLSAFPTDEGGDPLIRGQYPVNGVPHQFFIDNDVAFHAESFEKSALALGCHIDYLPPGEPWKKGKIERFWSTVQTTFFDMFPGKVLRIGENKDNDYDASKDAVLTLAELNFLLTKALVDYHHEGIEPGTDKKRIDLWNEGVKLNPPRPVRDHESLIELVGAYETRRAERRGIAIFGLWYNSHDLALYRSGFDRDPMVEIRYDPQNISMVWVIDKERGISFPVPCTRPDYVDGLSEHQHRVIRRHAAGDAAKGRLSVKQLQMARADLFELGRKLIKSKNASRTKRAVGRFLGVGRSVIDDITRPVKDGATNDYLDLEVEDDLEADRAKRDEAIVDAMIAARKAQAATPNEVANVLPREIAASEPPVQPTSVPPNAVVPASPRRKRDRTMRISHDRS